MKNKWKTLLVSTLLVIISLCSKVLCMQRLGEELDSGRGKKARLSESSSLGIEDHNQHSTTTQTQKPKKDPVNNKMDRLELLGALRTVVSETCKSVAELDLLTDARVMILGTTGAGKSTLIHHLVGRNVFATCPSDERSFKLCVNPEDQIGEAFAIGHGLISCTTHPNAYHDQANGIVWWDCPGFLDNKGIIQEFSNQLAVSKLFTGEKPSKILLVANEAKFRDARAKPVWDALEAIVTMFKGSDGSDDNKILQDLKNSLVFIVTHAPEDFDIEFEISKLNRYKPEMVTEIAKDLMSYLASNVNTKCFTSFKPSKEGLFKLSARTNILEALLTVPGSYLIARQASVDEYSKRCAEAVTNQIREEIQFCLSTYINSITSKIALETPLSDLVCFEKFFLEVEELANSTEDSEFLNKLQQIGIDGPSLPNLQETINNVINTAEVHPFLLKFGAPQLKIGQLWTNSAGMTLNIISNQKINNESINQYKEDSEKLIRKHDNDLKEQEAQHKKQLDEQNSLQELLKSENESIRIGAQEKLKELEQIITTTKQANEEKEREYQSKLKERELREKSRQQEAKKKFDKKLATVREDFEEEIKQKKKEIEEIKEKFSTSSSEDDKGVFVHIGRGLDNGGAAVKNFMWERVNDAKEWFSSWF